MPLPRRSRSQKSRVSPAKDEGGLVWSLTGETSGPAFALDAWSLTFEDKALEVEYLRSHGAIMRSSPRCYAIPLFTMFAAAMNIVLMILLHQNGRSLPQPSSGLGILFSPISFLGILLEKQFGFGDWGQKRFLQAMRVVITAFFIMAALQPYYQQVFNVCDSHRMANCALLNQGVAPYPVLLVVTVSPMILSVIFGMQWVPVVFVFVVTNAPAIYYIVSYQKVELEVCIITFITVSLYSIIMSWVLIRQERETFVWRKVALSESKVELERTFNAFLCHEIRNPFAVIKGFAECLVSDDSTTVLHTSSLIKHILDSCTHIQRILDNSLDLGKLEQHKLVLEDEHVELQKIGDQVASMMANRLKPGVQFLVQCPDVSFRGDNTRWLQLLLNLVSNAIKFTTRGVVRLDITAEKILPEDGRWAEESSSQCALKVQVTDTGCGISQEGQAVLFQKYQQVHGRQGPAKATAGAGAHEGTGLGLVISQHIVHLMGCRSGISVQSPWQCHEGSGGTGRSPVGVGTMFSFSVVPLNLVFNNQAPNLVSPDAPTHEPPTSGSSRQFRSPMVDFLPPAGRHVKATIMVVDDELLNRMVLLTKLRQSDLELDGARWGEMPAIFRWMSCRQSTRRWRWS